MGNTPELNLELPLDEDLVTCLVQQALGQYERAIEQVASTQQQLLHLRRRRAHRFFEEGWGDAGLFPNRRENADAAVHALQATLAQFLRFATGECALDQRTAHRLEGELAAAVSSAIQERVKHRLEDLA